VSASNDDRDRRHLCRRWAAGALLWGGVMLPRLVVPADLVYWEGFDPRPATFAADDPSFEPCPALLTTVRDEYGVVGPTVVRVPWMVDEIELAHLASGGTLWLSTWGGLPPHMLEVQPPVRGVRNSGAV